MHAKLTAVAHVAVWMIPLVVLAVNAFWWLPGIWLAEHKRTERLRFRHPEGVHAAAASDRQHRSTRRVRLDRRRAARDLHVLAARSHSRLGGVGFCAAGFGWGYLAGASRSLDFLQPGRHTYAFFTVLAVAGGAALARTAHAAARRSPGSATASIVGRSPGAFLIGIRVIGYPGYPLFESLRALVHTRAVPFQPPDARARIWVVDRVGRHLKPGQRLLYEEGGFGIPGVPDPFQGGRLSGLFRSAPACN